MNRMRTVSSIILLFSCFVLISGLLAAPLPAQAWSNGSNASLVLGQASFTGFAIATSQVGMNFPTSIAVDPTSGAVFVADMNNNRVLRYASLAALANGAPASGVLGQAGFATSAPATTQAGMNYPAGVSVDSAGRLWVADQGNNRVLRFDAAASKPNGAGADGVLGQALFTTNSTATSQTGMKTPVGVAVDGAGRLWVADYVNNRVLRFDGVASKPNGAPADGVLGQVDFTTSTPATSQNGMRNPYGVAIDSAGRLWVADYNNSRVLRFDGAAAKANGAPADGVLGQPDFISSAFATNQAGMHNPIGVAVDSAGRLWVADYDNNRVLRFDGAASKTSGAAADGVLGQANFTSSAAATSQTGMHSPAGVAVDGAGRVWVADYTNHRVLLFEDQVTIRITRLAASPTHAASLSFQVAFDGPVSGLAVSNFSLATTGTISGASVSSVSSVSASVYTVTVASGSGSGTIRLDLANATNLAPAGVLPAVPYSGGESYTIDMDTRPASAWSNGPNASLVLGQSNFTSSAAASSQAGMSTPNGIAVDPTSGAVFVADTNNNRVLRYASLATLADGAPASGVLGQPDFTSTTPINSSTGMNRPAGVAVDSVGRLWVADTMSRRVLRFDGAASKPNGAAADGVLGQPDFTVNFPARSQAGMDNPSGVAVDGAGRLWVADTGNSRVLRFDGAAGRANGAPADGVLGQVLFTTSTPATSQAGMRNPFGVTVDSIGRLWVADQGNSRVLRFDGAANKPNNAAADGVLGQLDFNSGVSGEGQAGMYKPSGMAVDSAGRLWVADTNCRVLRFDNAASKPNGAAADGVLGQALFTTITPAVSQTGMNNPAGVTVDSAGRLWVVDTFHHRVLLFEDRVTIRITRLAASPSHAASLSFQVAFDGPVSGLAVSNFSLATTGTVSGASVSSVSSVSASVYSVTVASGSGSGTIRLDLANATNLAPASVLPAVPYSGGESYTIDMDTRPASAWSDGPNASLVLGQPNFTSSAAASSQAGMSTPNGIAVDPTSGAVFVADTNNNRVLRYASLTALANGAPASGVLGQADFTSSAFASSQAGMSSPRGITVDSAGRLWVVDFGNNRVLRFDGAASKPNGAAADGVLGQADFTSSAFATSQAGMSNPTGVAVDGAGRLWVADTGNNRVLRFDGAAGKANGAAADGVLGQADFISNAAATSQAGMSSPVDITADSGGRIWVVDFANSRVLRFDNAANKPNGAGANAVLGQAGFTTSTTATSQAGMYFPYGAAVDSAGRLWVAELANNRVLRFDAAASKASGAAADGVLGQAGFATNTFTTTSQKTLFNPVRVAVDGAGHVWVADGSSNRVLLFEDQVKTGITRLDASPTNAASLRFQVTFDGPLSGLSASNFSLTGTGSVSGASISGISQASASVYTVTVNTGSGSGTIRLDLANTTGLAPATILPGVPYTGGEVYSIDKTPPAAPRVDMPAQGSHPASLRPQIGGTAGAAEPGAALTVKEGPVTICAATAAGDGNWSCTPSADLSAGVHVFSIIQTDAAGNPSQPASVSFTAGFPVYLPEIVR